MQGGRLSDNRLLPSLAWMNERLTDCTLCLASAKLLPIWYKTLTHSRHNWYIHVDLFMIWSSLQLGPEAFPVQGRKTFWLMIGLDFQLTVDPSLVVPSVRNFGLPSWQYRGAGPITKSKVGPRELVRSSNCLDFLMESRVFFKENDKPEYVLFGTTLGN